MAHEWRKYLAGEFYGQQDELADFAARKAEEMLALHGISKRRIGEHRKDFLAGALSRQTILEVVKSLEKEGIKPSSVRGLMHSAGLPYAVKESGDRLLEHMREISFAARQLQSVDARREINQLDDPSAPAFLPMVLERAITNIDDLNKAACLLLQELKKRPFPTVLADTERRCDLLLLYPKQAQPLDDAKRQTDVMVSTRRPNFAYSLAPIEDDEDNSFWEGAFLEDDDAVAKNGRLRDDAVSAASRDDEGGASPQSPSADDVTVTTRKGGLLGGGRDDDDEPSIFGIVNRGKNEKKDAYAAGALSVGVALPGLADADRIELEKQAWSRACTGLLDLRLKEFRDLAATKKPEMQLGLRRVQVDAFLRQHVPDWLSVSDIEGALSNVTSSLTDVVNAFKETQTLSMGLFEEFWRNFERLVWFKSQFRNQHKEVARLLNRSAYARRMRATSRPYRYDDILASGMEIALEDIERRLNRVLDYSHDMQTAVHHLSSIVTCADEILNTHKVSRRNRPGARMRERLGPAGKALPEPR